jgi:hypothetical protein
MVRNWRGKTIGTWGMMFENSLSLHALDLVYQRVTKERQTCRNVHFLISGKGIALCKSGKEPVHEEMNENSNCKRTCIPRSTSNVHINNAVCRQETKSIMSTASYQKYMK